MRILRLNLSSVVGHQTEPIGRVRLKSLVAGFSQVVRLIHRVSVPRVPSKASGCVCRCTVSPTSRL